MGRDINTYASRGMNFRQIVKALQAHDRLFHFHNAVLFNDLKANDLKERSAKIEA
jgi:hypothetical protein